MFVQSTSHKPRTRLFVLRNCVTSVENTLKQRVIHGPGRGRGVYHTVSEHARRESGPVNAFDLSRWVPDHTAPYDLHHYDDHFAFAKAQGNLSGDYYWLAQYG